MTRTLYSYISMSLAATYMFLRFVADNQLFLYDTVLLSLEKHKSKVLLSHKRRIHIYIYISLFFQSVAVAAICRKPLVCIGHNRAMHTSDIALHVYNLQQSHSDTTTATCRCRIVRVHRVFIILCSSFFVLTLDYHRRDSFSLSSVSFPTKLFSKYL